jgi:catalase-peroxidase
MAGCPFAQTTPTNGPTNRDWWPNQLNLHRLHQHSSASNPMHPDFDYASAFAAVDLAALKKDIHAIMTDSQSWWPADYGHYGPFFIRMAWHSAGTYRVTDGRGGASAGQLRFAPLNSWPDNVNLEKARRLLWPVKKKYGNAISWADLYILAGNCALESMGVKLVGFSGGREDVYEPEDGIYWGSERKWLDDQRYGPNSRQLQGPLAAVQMGLIYVNPEGPNGNPDPVAAGHDVRETFNRMGMTDEETVALIAGGHTFGKCHGAGPSRAVGPEVESAPVEQQGMGWKSKWKSGKGGDTISSGIEGAWKPNPICWDMGYLTMLFKYEWELVKSPAGAHQWLAKDVAEEDMITDAHDSSQKHRPMMTTADLSLRFDAVLRPIAEKYKMNPHLFADAFARAWFKLTHRDMGPRSRYVGRDIPATTWLWQDPLPASSASTGLQEADISGLRKRLALCGLSPAQLVTVAWQSASTFRQSDKRGGANGARLRLLPQREWEVNEPEQLQQVLSQLIALQTAANVQLHRQQRHLSLADLLVLAGNVGVEQAAEAVNLNVRVPFMPGRTDATQEETDIQAFGWLEPAGDGFRNYLSSNHPANADSSESEQMLIDRAQLLGLSAPEMTVLLGGMRVIGTNFHDSPHGVFTERKGALSTDFFVNLLDMTVEWKPMDGGLYEGVDRSSGRRRWTATRVDLLFGSHAQLRALSEVYAQDDAKERFVHDFVAVWSKVMQADRFEVRSRL